MKKIIIITGILLFAGFFCCEAGNMEVKIFKIKYNNAESLSRIANNLKSSEGKVTFDANSNSLIVVDYPQNIASIAGIIESLDVREKQVEIKVSVVESSSEFFQSLGVTSAGIISPDDYNAVLSAINTSKDANVKTQMTVRTQSNQPAQIQVSTDEIIGNEVITYESGTTVISPIREPIGSFLEVLPVVNDDRITVTLRPSVSTLEKGANPSERTILTSVEINDGDTVAIGGVDSDKQVNKNTGTLFDIPLSSKSKSKSKKVIMFLTAKIVD